MRSSHGVLVDHDAYLLEVCRYVELNPVRAAMVHAPDAWPWSSYLAHVNRVEPPDWLDTAGLHGYLLGHAPEGPEDQRRAAARYVELVAAGRDVRLWDDALRQQIYLGDESFVERMQALAGDGPVGSPEVPRAQRRRTLTLQQCLDSDGPRERALRRAHVEGGMTMTALARELGLSVSRVSRLIARAEKDQTRGDHGGGRHGPE